MKRKDDELVPGMTPKQLLRVLIEDSTIYHTLSTTLVYQGTSSDGSTSIQWDIFFFRNMQGFYRTSDSQNKTLHGIGTRKGPCVHHLSFVGGIYIRVFIGHDITDTTVLRTTFIFKML